MKRFFVDKITAVGGLCSITGAEAKHMARVLRMKPGDRIVLTDSRGERYQALIQAAGPKEVRAWVEKSLPKPGPSPLKITLCQAVLKSAPMDYLIQKGSELGVNAFTPFTSERTVVRLTGERLQNKMRHWREIARNAAKQSDRVSPAEVLPLTSLAEIMTRVNHKDALKLILWEQEGTKDLKTRLKTAPPATEVIGIVGPEGGFSREEIHGAIKAGFAPVSMGRRVLRAETAGLTLAAILQYEWGDLGLP